MTLVLVSGPAELPISVPEVKAHTVIEDDADDFLVETYIRSALEEIEAKTGRTFLAQTWRWVGDAFPSGDEISLEIGPIASVTSVGYVDENGDAQTLDPAEYRVDATSAVGRVVLVGSAWPSTSTRHDAVQVEFVAGGGAIPESLRHSIMLAVARSYKAREGEDGDIVGDAGWSLVSKFRRICFG